MTARAWGKGEGGFKKKNNSNEVELPEHEYTEWAVWQEQQAAMLAGTVSELFSVCME